MKLKELLKVACIYNGILLRIDREKSISFVNKDDIKGDVLDYEVDCIGISHVKENELVIDVCSNHSELQKQILISLINRRTI